MYSESNDFSEKDAIFSEMVKLVSLFSGKKWSDLIERGFALEIGGSGGLLAGIVSETARRVICTDVVDTQMQYGGEFPKLLKEKFKRNGRDLNLEKIEFQVGDAQSLNYRDNLFDIVFSQNAFEHIPNPKAAICEALRVLKPGGILYVTFDPVWTADSGSHFLEFVKEPWLHLLLTDDEFCRRMAQNGAQEWQLASYRSDMNRLPCSFYRQELPLLLKSLATKFEFEEWSGCVDNSYLGHANLEKSARKLNCHPNDLLIRGFRLMAIK